MILRSVGISPSYILNEQLIGYLMMRALNAQLLKSFPKLWECLPMRLLNPTYLFSMLATWDAGKYFSRKIFFIAFQVPMDLGRIEKSHAFAAPFREKGKAFNLTCSSSTPFGFMSTQTIWNSLRWVWGSSPTSPLNVGSKCIKPNLSSKLTLLLMFMHNGWFFILGAASSLSVYCRAIAMELTQAFVRKLRKVFSISRSTCTCLWLVERITWIKGQGNSKETGHTRDWKQCKLNENPTLEN